MNIPGKKKQANPALEVVELLLTLVSERRINTGQQVEMQHRKIVDLTGHDSNLPSYRRRLALLTHEEMALKTLLKEMEGVADFVLGKDWRESH